MPAVEELFVGEIDGKTLLREVQRGKLDWFLTIDRKILFEFSAQSQVTVRKRKSMCSNVDHKKKMMKQERTRRKLKTLKKEKRKERKLYKKILPIHIIN